MNKPVPKFYGTIVKIEGKRRFKPDAPKQYQTYLDYSFKEGDRGYFVLKKYRAVKKRTTGKYKETIDEESNQNGYLWGVVLPILCDFFGMPAFEMLDALRPLFFFEVNDKDPNIKRLKSTTEYNTLEWEEKMQEIRTWAITEHAIHIPTPNEAEA